MRMMTSGLAIACLLAAPVAGLAQSTDESTQEPAVEGAVTAEGEVTAPAAEAEGTVTAEGEATAPVTDGATDGAIAESGTATETEEAPKPVEGQIVLQSEDSMLANDLIGSTVYSPDNESVGDINDVIVKLDGTVEGVVIGVGGFLGIGEKEVAVTMDQIELASFESGGTRLVLNASRADLEAAPEFKTAAEQRAEEQVIEMQNDTTTTDPAVNN